MAPTPLLLSPSDVTFFQQLGQDLLAFYRALNRLYQESVRGIQPAWVADYLDQGKPESLVTYSRMNRFRNLFPASFGRMSFRPPTAWLSRNSIPCPGASA